MTDVNRIKSVGIIGLGSFGRFAASIVPVGVRVVGYDIQPRHAVGQLEQSDLAQTASADAVVLAIPLGSIGSTLDAIAPFVRPDAVVADVCSVKSRTEELFSMHLPNHKNVLLTHPLFGPESAAKSTKEHKLIVTKSIGARAEQLIDACRTKLGLEVISMKSVEHDALMAEVHVLTLFIARGLADMQLRNQTIITPSYRMLLDLIGLDGAHSDELFKTIQLGNPFASDMRRRLLQVLDSVDEALGKEAVHEV